MFERIDQTQQPASEGHRGYPVGHRRWAIAEGYIPGWSNGPEPQFTSHETICLLNASDEDAKRLSDNTLTLAEFLRIEDYEPPKLEREAIVHRHCHQYAVMGFEAEQGLYGKMGLDYEVLDSGCCGLAGSCGFEEGKYKLSMKIGERRLLPAVRGAKEGAIIMADGFSCKTQVAQGTDRRPLHTAQVIKMALDERREVIPSGGRPEARYPDVVAEGDSPDFKVVAVARAVLGVLAVAAGALARASRHRAG